MRITNELRKWARDNTVQGEVLATLPAQHPIRGTVESLLRIADRIDAEHESVRAESIVDMTDESMAEHGWVRLPVDADGEPIHMGDLVTVPWKDKVYEVAGFSCTKQLCSGIRTIWIDVYSPEKQRNVPLCGADSCRHHKQPTVEDVLDEMLQRFSEDGYEGGMYDLIAEYASKLREMLAGDEE